MASNEIKIGEEGMHFRMYDDFSNSVILIEKEVDESMSIIIYDANMTMTACFYPDDFKRFKDFINSK